MDDATVSAAMPMPLRSLESGRVERLGGLPVKLRVLRRRTAPPLGPPSRYHRRGRSLGKPLSGMFRLDSPGPAVLVDLRFHLSPTLCSPDDPRPKAACRSGGSFGCRRDSSSEEVAHPQEAGRARYGSCAACGFRRAPTVPGDNPNIAVRWRRTCRGAGGALSTGNPKELPVGGSAARVGELGGPCNVTSRWDPAAGCHAPVWAR